MTDPVLRTMDVAAAAPARGRDPAQQRVESPAFHALLESLERVARGTAPASTVDDPESLRRAIADADSGFKEVMDLRRRLEDAFRAGMGTGPAAGAAGTPRMP